MVGGSFNEEFKEILEHEVVKDKLCGCAGWIFCLPCKLFCCVATCLCANPYEENEQLESIMQFLDSPQNGQSHRYNTFFNKLLNYMNNKNLHNDTIFQLIAKTHREYCRKKGLDPKAFASLPNRNQGFGGQQCFRSPLHGSIYRFVSPTETSNLSNQHRYTQMNDGVEVDDEICGMLCDLKNLYTQCCS